MRHTFTLLAILARFVTALVLPVERDDTSAEQLGDCEIWEYYGQISQLADDIGVCLTVVGNSAENGKPVSVSPCVNEDDENFQWQSWIVSRGENNLIRFEGTEYCLYAGNVPANGNKVTLQPCSEIGQSPGAWWWYTDIGDDHIASTGQGQCLIRKSEFEGDEAEIYQNNHVVQTWECSGSDPNQIWVTE